MKGNMLECLCLIFLLLHQTSGSTPEEFMVHAPPGPIIAAVGDDIVLPCYLKPNISAEDMTVEWFRIPPQGRVVYLYQDREIRNEDQIRSFTGRTALFPEELKRGNVSLRVAKVRASDEGRYQCNIKSKMSQDDVSVRVQIQGIEPVISMEVPHRAGWVSLLCESKGWDIQPDLLWLDSEGHSLPAAATETHRDSEDLYTVRRRVIIQDRDTNTVTCRVDLRQPKLQKDTTFHITAEMFPVPRWKASLAVFLPLVAVALIGCAVLTHRYKKLQRKKKEQDEFLKAQRALKTDLKKKCECIDEALAQQGHRTLLNEIYTELYITEGGGGGVNSEHEVRHIEAATKNKTTQETAILCNDIFKPLPGQKKHIRTVLTKGIAGIGKTVSVQKFILDWAEGKANQDIHFIFTLPFQDLNMKKEKKFSLLQLLLDSFPQLKEIKSIGNDKVKVMFIFDGLDECQLSLDFQNNEICCDVTESASVDVLLTNLIKGNLLPTALLWITSRPAAANQIPPECVHQVTEIQGFNDSQKEEYFRKKIKYKTMASRIISHIQSCRSLHLMCHLPVFCWNFATVLESILGQSESEKLPETLTEMCTHLLFIQSREEKQKHHDDNNGTTSNKTSSSDTEMIMKLGKLAFEELEKGKQIYSSENLRERDIDVSDASAYSGLCTEIFKEESGLNQETGYCFVHPSIQEYLAALFVFNSCVKGNISVCTLELHNTELTDLHKRAMNVASKSENGELELFLRFLLGLSLDSIQTFIGGLPKQTGSTSQSIKETINSIKQKIREEPEAGRTINLFHCLNEINVNALEKEIQTILAEMHDDKLEPDQCSAWAFHLLKSEEALDEFDLKRFDTSTAGYQRLVPIVRNCRKAIMRSSNLTEESLLIVATALQESNSPLRELDLSYNDLGDSGVKLICAGLKSPNCKLQTLRLDRCDLTKKSCEFVALALQSPNSSLRELDLSYNDLGDSGVKLLCDGLKSPNCNLQSLRLGQCTLTVNCCGDLAAVLSSPHSELRDLELRDNILQDSGVAALYAGLVDTNCKLKKLGLSGCRFTKGSCDVLEDLRSKSSHLRELDLSNNYINDQGVRALSAAKQDTITLTVDPTGESSNPGPRGDDCRVPLVQSTADKNPSSSTVDGETKEKSYSLWQNDCLVTVENNMANKNPALSKKNTETNTNSTKCILS